jgi:Asp-tRNA(Asn)/Glu-tRNA(Gln) amidotransferase A subunit family amidase
MDRPRGATAPPPLRGILGRALTVVARMPVPIVAPDRIAARRPDPGFEPADAHPLVEVIEPRAAVIGGVLDGDVVIKDQIDVAGLPTGIGLSGTGERAARDATIVARIAAAGGRIVGKAKMTELGIDGIGTLMHYPIPVNPRAPGYAPGGSSTGTAVAVATGLARYGVGGDGLGSIRVPSACCGLVGLKPSRDRLPRDGIRSPVRTLDAVGPMARTAADCALLWQVMAGERVAPLSPWVPERMAVPRLEGTLRVARAVQAAFTRILGALSAEVEQVTLPGLSSATFLGGMIGASELATGPLGARTQTAAGRRSLAIGGAFSPRDVERLAEQRAALRAETERLLERVPVLAMPTMAIPPPALTRALLAGATDLVTLRALGAFTPLANLADLPAIAVPCGVDDRGRPLSVMFLAPRGGETALLRLALAVEHTGLGERPV